MEYQAGHLSPGHPIRQPRDAYNATTGMVIFVAPQGGLRPAQAREYGGCTNILHPAVVVSNIRQVAATGIDDYVPDTHRRASYTRHRGVSSVSSQYPSAIPDQYASTQLVHTKLCRCGAYVRIREAIKQASRE